jgi:hypothetical protein
MDPNPQMNPLPAIAQRSENVDPPMRVTGTRRIKSALIPEAYPSAIPRDETCEVAADLDLAYSSLATA